MALFRFNKKLHQANVVLDTRIWMSDIRNLYLFFSNFSSECPAKYVGAMSFTWSSPNLYAGLANDKNQTHVSLQQFIQSHQQPGGFFCKGKVKSNRTDSAKVWNIPGWDELGLKTYDPNSIPTFTIPSPDQPPLSF